MMTVYVINVDIYFVDISHSFIMSDKSFGPSGYVQ